MCCVLSIIELVGEKFDQKSRDGGQWYQQFSAGVTKLTRFEKLKKYFTLINKPLFTLAENFPKIFVVNIDPCPGGNNVELFRSLKHTMRYHQ